MNNLPAKLKLFMVLLGSKAPQRNVEQHDYFFAIGNSLKDLIPKMKAFWPEAGNSLHVDGWREVNFVDGYQIEVIPKLAAEPLATKKLFFINLGGYQSNKLEEQHYTLLSVQDDRTLAVHNAKNTVFFKSNTIKGAGSHIDEKYGIDVDDIYHIEDILTPEEKTKYRIQITPATDTAEDIINLGYFKLDKIR
jgi:hypothetical protein